MSEPFITFTPAELTDTLPELTGTEVRLWIYLMSMVAADNCVYLHTMLRKDVQASLGFNQNTLSRTLTQLAKKGIIEKMGQSIVKVKVGDTATAVYKGNNAAPAHIRRMPGFTTGTSSEEADGVLPGVDEDKN